MSALSITLGEKGKKGHREDYHHLGIIIIMGCHSTQSLEEQRNKGKGRKSALALLVIMLMKYISVVLRISS